MQMQMTSADRGMIMTNFNRKQMEKTLGRVVVKGGVKAAGKQETTQMIRFVEQVLDKQETTLMRRFVDQVLDHTSCKTGESVDNKSGFKERFKECNRGGRDSGKKSPKGNGPQVERVKNLTRDTMQFPRSIQVNIINVNLEPKLDPKLTECVKGQDLIFKEECTGKDSEESPYLTGIEGVCGVKNSENFAHNQGSHSAKSSD